jgi:Zn-dependent membrane protease YugP
MGLFSGSYLTYMIPAFLLSLLTQWWVSSTYARWSKVGNNLKLTGADAAERLLRHGGLNDVRVESVPGRLTDHYDPRTRTLRLSAPVSQSPSIASLAVTAHEIGHAMQDRQGYFPLRMRSALVPAASIGSSLAWILILVGIMLNSLQLAWLGVFAFAIGALFALATLPVEINASSRARVLLRETGLIQTEAEAVGVGSVLNAAAFTYVAALAAAILQLLYFGGMVGGLGGRRR